MGNCVDFELYLSVMNINYLLLQCCAYRDQTGNFVELKEVQRNSLQLRCVLKPNRQFC